MTLLSGEQRPDPADVVHQGDLLVWTLHPALGPASLLGGAAQPMVPSQCCCDGGASPSSLERHLLCVLLVVILRN